jgi:hypothetical protein
MRRSGRAHEDSSAARAYLMIIDRNAKAVIRILQSTNRRETRAA